MARENIIEIENLVARYGDTVVLRGVSAVIPENQICVILAASGGGKTTLLKHIIGLLTPESGDIRVFGESIIGMSEVEFNEVLQQVGMLFQGGALFNSLEVWENVAMPLMHHTDLPDDIIEQLVRQKLALVGLEHAYHLLPAELSGGMKKRVALARAIALEPRILFFDEPSAGLDPVTARALDGLIIRLKEQLGLTLVIVTHELDSIKRIADRILFLENGQLVFSGSVEETKTCGIEAIEEFFQWKQAHPTHSRKKTKRKKGSGS